MTCGESCRISMCCGTPAKTSGNRSTILEAMAAGVPVIASDTPTHRELVVDGRNWLFDSARAPALAGGAGTAYGSDFYGCGLGGAASGLCRVTALLKTFLPKV